MTGVHPLDKPGPPAPLRPQPHLARAGGAGLRYAADVSPFVGLPDDPGPDDWSNLAKLTGAGGVAATAGIPAVPPPGWQVLMNVDAVQLTGELAAAAADAEAI